MLRTIMYDCGVKFFEVFLESAGNKLGTELLFFYNRSSQTGEQTEIVNHTLSGCCII